ncbi:hypothetical protein [Shewanella surugensis]|uniref:Uncharacterized protein n=1 Tax=Shewanella surugensis TaxID=212020 RepID=A0ABT0LK36_9GAMM|nr:hypothetical protein [Shewanella surugensis]MCL1128077.1 hypothetical protein [Shewanella surugensis]
MYTVDYGRCFLENFKYFPEADKNKITEFIEHYEDHGLVGLPGRIKNSDNVDPNDPEFLSKVKYAQEHKLWHYHLGIPNYDESNSFGDWTSEYLLHYQSVSLYEIKIVDFDYHPPFSFPESNYLT